MREVSDSDERGIGVAFAGVLQLAEDLVDDGAFLIGEGCSVSDKEPNDMVITGLYSCRHSMCVRASAVLEEILDALRSYVASGN